MARLNKLKLELDLSTKFQLHDKTSKIFFFELSAKFQLHDKTIAKVGARFEFIKISITKQKLKLELGISRTRFQWNGKIRKS